MDLEAEVRVILINEMTKALEKLVRYIQEELTSAFSWTPVIYERTGNTQRSVYISKPPSIVNNIITGEISFRESEVWHDSVMGSGQPKGNTSWLLEVGWDISGKTGKNRENFDTHKGYHYIDKAVGRFNSESKNGIQVHVYMGEGKYI